MDTPLSKQGEKQAQAFCDYWHGTFAKLQSEGRLHFYVSPMKRNMQTADPLLKRLGCKALAHGLIRQFGEHEDGSLNRRHRGNSNRIGLMRFPEEAAALPGSIYSSRNSVYFCRSCFFM